MIVNLTCIVPDGTTPVSGPQLAPFVQDLVGDSVSLPAIPEGTNVDFVLTFKGQDGADYNLTGHTVKLTIRRTSSVTVPLLANTDDTSTTNVSTISVRHSQTSGQKPRTFVYGVELIYPNEDVDSVIPESRLRMVAKVGNDSDTVTSPGSSYGSLEEAVAALGAVNPRRLAVSVASTLSADLTITPNIAVDFLASGVIDLNGHTLTIHGPMQSDLCRIFTGSGSVVFSPYSTEYISPQWWGAVGDGTTDCTTALQSAVTCAMASGNKTVFVPTGEYLITDTITIGQGIKFKCSGTQGSTEQYGTTFKHASTSSLFVWDSSGAAFASTGGGLEDALIIKATGYQGGDAIKLLALDANDRPGEMVFKDVLTYGSGTGRWDHILNIDGTAANLSGGRGVRSVSLWKFRGAGCNGDTYPNEAILLNQAVHFYAQHLQLDPSGSSGEFGMKIKGNWDDIFIASAEINGKLVIEEAPDTGYQPIIEFSGTAAGGVYCTCTKATGHLELASAAVIENDSPNLRTSNSDHGNVVAGPFTQQLINTLTHYAANNLGLKLKTVSQASDVNYKDPPYIELEGSAWNEGTDALQINKWFIGALMTNGDPPDSQLTLASSEDGADYESRAYITRNGDIVASGTNVYAGGAAGTGAMRAAIFDAGSASQVAIGTTNATAIVAGQAGITNTHKGDVFVFDPATPATAIATTKDGVEIRLQGYYWSAGASNPYYGFLKQVITDTAVTAYLDLREGIGSFRFHSDASFSIADGQNAAVSGAQRGSFRYNNALGVLQVSENGGAFDTLVKLTASQTLTNKTLTAPVINGASSASGNFDLSGSSGTFKTPTGAATFGGSSNTFTNPITLPAGTGTQTGKAPCTIYSNTSPVSSTTAGGEAVGQSYTMPANTLSADGQSIRILSYWKHAANTNATTYKWYFNAVAMVSASNSTSNDTITTDITMTRLTSSTIQLAGYISSSAGGITTVRGIFTSQNFAASIVIKNSVTGAVADGDLTANGLVVHWWPA